MFLLYKYILEKYKWNQPWRNECDLSTKYAIGVLEEIWVPGCGTESSMSRWTYGGPMPSCHSAYEPLYALLSPPFSERRVCGFRTVAVGLKSQLSR